MFSIVAELTFTVEGDSIARQALTRDPQGKRKQGKIKEDMDKRYRNISKSKETHRE